MHHTLKVCSIATGSFTSVEDEDQQDSAVDVNDGEEEEDVEDGDEESAEEDDDGEDGEEEEGKVLFSQLLVGCKLVFFFFFVVVVWFCLKHE